VFVLDDQDGRSHGRGAWYIGDHLVPSGLQFTDSRARLDGRPAMPREVPTTVSTRPELVAQRRVILGKKVADLRREGILPAVVYGHGDASESIQLDARAFDDVRRHHGRNTLLDLTVDGGKPRPVLVHAIAEHPVKRNAVHVDFYVVKMTEEMTVDVPVVATGESFAVEKLGGTLLHSLDSVKVRALPADLPQSFEADISGLETFDDVVRAGELALPERVTLVTDPNEVVLRMQPPRVEEAPIVEAVEEEEGAEPGAEGAAEGGEAEGDSEES
jgi:large subunit ribosomal protein L25